MRDRMDSLKKAYEEIVIPEQLASVTEAAIQRALKDREATLRPPRRTAGRWLKRICASVAGLLVALTVGVNTMPAFASGLEQVPGLGSLVRILQFNKNGAQGGVITDSTNINVISLRKDGTREHIVIHFEQYDQPQQTANSFSVRYSEYPNTMAFSIGGVRRFTAERDLAALRESGLIEDAYPIMSLDDSLIRFNITFKDNVIYEVKEYEEPAQVVLTIEPSRSEADTAAVYSVRTSSSPYGETQGIYEEMLFGLEGLRTLKDRQGTYFVEAGYCGTEAEAKAMLKELKTSYGFEDNLYIEKREPSSIPEAISVEPETAQ